MQLFFFSFFWFTINSGPVFICYTEIWFGGLADPYKYTAVLLECLFVFHRCYFCSFNLSAWYSHTDFSFSLKNTHKKRNISPCLFQQTWDWTFTAKQCQWVPVWTWIWLLMTMTRQHQNCPFLFCKIGIEEAVLAFLMDFHTALSF